LLKGRGIVLTNQYDNNNLQREESKVGEPLSEELMVTEVSQGGRPTSKGRRRRQGGAGGALDKITKKIEQTNKNLSDVIDRGSFAEVNVNYT
jgi:hypothetical protein